VIRRVSPPVSRRAGTIAIGATLLIVAASLLVNGQTADKAPTARVALTFDDLPTHGPLPEGMSRTDVAARIIDALRSRRTPAIYGFINAKKSEGQPENAEVLRLWRAAGFPLGNHAWSHMDLHANTSDAFEQDIVANETTLQTLMGDGDWRWFRYPYLREGDTPEKHRAIATFLKARGYQVAQVTISFDDYAYNDPYARCLAKQDSQGLDWLSRNYLTRAEASLTRAQAASRALFDRDIAHVLLLHIGAFETVMLPKLLDLLEARGFALTTLEEAQRDPAYRALAEGLTTWNGTWLDQLAAARRLPPTPDPDRPFATLSTLCR
jgi:peptidoglycan-N-acetylglucosamine deacetylase